MDNPDLWDGVDALASIFVKWYLFCVWVTVVCAGRFSGLYGLEMDNPDLWDNVDALASVFVKWFLANLMFG
jgi:hypothetical protein